MRQPARGETNVLRGPVGSRSWGFEICILTSPTKTDYHSLCVYSAASTRAGAHRTISVCVSSQLHCSLWINLKSYKYICCSQEQPEVTFVLLWFWTLSGVGVVRRLPCPSCPVGRKGSRGWRQWRGMTRRSCRRLSWLAVPLGCR